MKKAIHTDKETVIDILTNSFQTNQSVNYIVKQDQTKDSRIKSLMGYSYEVCNEFGEVFLSDDMKACALILYPDRKKSSLKMLYLDLKLIFRCIGIRNINKAMRREALIKSKQPKDPMYYIWFIGVKSEYQGSGIGTTLLLEVLEHSKKTNRPVYLETSTSKNLPWYKKHNFEIYSELDLGYKLFFLKRAYNF